MTQRNIVAGIDVGTTKVCTIIAEVNNNGTIEVIGVGTSPSTGLKKGMVVDIDDTVNSIEDSVVKAERMAGVELESVFVGIAGSHISSTNRHGVVAVTGENKEITRNDIDRVIDATKIISMPPERQIIHVIPREFIVDGCKDIKYPLGMSGVRLEAEAHIVTGSVTSIQNLVKSVKEVNIGVEGIVLQPLAASKAVLSESEKDLGVLLVDMGGGTTDIAIFKEGSIWYTSILPVGGDHVTNDIAVGMRTPRDIAEKIKIKHGCAKADLIGQNEKINILDTSGKQQRTISRKVLCNIIEPRIDEIFSLVKEDIEKAGYKGLVPAGAVVTGGGSLLEGVSKLASEKLDMPVRIGAPENIDSLLDCVEGSIYDLDEEYSSFSGENGAIFSTGVGLGYYGAENMTDKTTAKTNRDEEQIVEDLFDKMRKWFKNIL
ncbi:cell division protein FtsA [Halobacteroides halobius DSM 5150]|uniref:Cell division protein FtsA n=1 Tax=Halobacteroides halobius (strain ATCC 35273 / DSM 5150 / MD-1) TaxID=748449 RepID=L0KBE0_HALHC|nr:cell division protein FtsA [Halobacteroides halobius]AGB41699.1 cell division protein FtsA [Halobacteroides halobius DSM 5150]